MSELSFSLSRSSEGCGDRRTGKIYQSLRESLQEVERLVNEVNTNYKNLEPRMNRAARLVKTIKNKRSSDTAESTVTGDNT